MEQIAAYDYATVFANNLRLLIDSRGITAKGLSDETGIPNATIYRYLHRDRAPKMNNIITIAQFFNVSIDWLMGLTDDRRKGWPENVVGVANLYSAASPSDRRVVDAVLEKYARQGQ